MRTQQSLPKHISPYVLPGLQQSKLRQTLQDWIVRYAKSRRDVSKWVIEVTIRATEQITTTSRDIILERTRVHEAVFARYLIVSVSQRFGPVPYERLAATLGRNRSTLQVGQRSLEKLKAQSAMIDRQETMIYHKAWELLLDLAFANHPPAFIRKAMAAKRQLPS